MRKKAVKAHLVEGVCDIANVQILTAAEKSDPSVEVCHYHNCYQVVIVKRGSVHGMLGYAYGELQAGSVLMIGRNLPHGIVSVSDDFEGMLIHIPFNIIPWSADSFPELYRDICFMEDSQSGYLFHSPSLSSEIERLATEMERESGFMKISCLFRLLHVLSHSGQAERFVFGTESEYSLMVNKDETSVDRAFRFISQHFQEEITLDMIAEYANQNKTALCRAFKKKSGVTIFQFINRLKIEKACQMLLSTDLSIAQVAYRVGYNTLSHFSTQFHLVMKMSPNQYRQNIGL